MWEWHITFPLSRFAPKSRMGEPLHRSMSLPIKESGRVQEDGLQTVQLLPVIITGRCGHVCGCGLHFVQMMRGVGSC